jgi:hypothetical protein
MRLVDEMSASRRTVWTLKASKVRRMKQEELLYVVTEYDLDVDIRKFTSTKRKADAAIADLVAWDCSITRRANGSNIARQASH